MFLHYPRDTAQTQLEARAEADPSVLDRMEASYAAYAASRYTAVPDGYDELQTPVSYTHLDVYKRQSQL